MRTRLFLSGFAVAIAVAATTSVSASDQTAAQDKAVTTQQASQPAAATKFTTLKSIKAVPMKSTELERIKGEHIHFFVNGQGHPGGGPFFVNRQENNLGGGQAPVGSGPGYSGLCNASAGGTSAIFIPAGQGC